MNGVAVYGGGGGNINGGDRTCNDSFVVCHFRLERFLDAPVDSDANFPLIVACHWQYNNAYQCRIPSEWGILDKDIS